MGSVVLNCCSLSRAIEPFRLYGFSLCGAIIIEMGSTELSLLRQFFASTTPHVVERDGEEDNFAIGSTCSPGSESQGGAERQARKY